MGLNIADLVNTAFLTVNSVVDGAVENVIYKYANGDPSYNGTTGAVTHPLADITVKAIRKKLTVKDSMSGGVYGIPGFQVKSDDRVYLIPRADLGRMPTINDKIQNAAGELLNVVGFNPDPTTTAALLTVVVRKP